MESKDINCKMLKYWDSIDLLKGLLVVIVYLGHIVPGGLQKVFFRYAIYAFHMPLFIGISGFLFKTKNYEKGLIKLMQKYWKRLIRPWMIAIIVYFILNNNTYSLDILVNSFIIPYYHLWYVVGIVSYMLLLFLLWKLFKKKWQIILVLSLFVSIVSKSNIIQNSIENDVILYCVNVLKII